MGFGIASVADTWQNSGRKVLQDHKNIFNASFPKILNWSNLSLRRIDWGLGLTVADTCQCGVGPEVQEVFDAARLKLASGEKVSTDFKSWNLNIYLIQHKLYSRKVNSNRVANPSDTIHGGNVIITQSSNRPQGSSKQKLKLIQARDSDLTEEQFYSGLMISKSFSLTVNVNKIYFKIIERKTVICHARSHWPLVSCKRKGLKLKRGIVETRALGGNLKEESLDDLALV